MSELDRAKQYRIDAQARENERLARERALAGDPGALRALKQKTYALRRWTGWSPKEKVHGDAN